MLKRRDDNRGEKILKFGKKIQLYFEFVYSREHVYRQLCQHAFKCSEAKLLEWVLLHQHHSFPNKFIVEYLPPTPGFTLC